MSVEVINLARPVVLAHGCFDLLHLGHIRHLREAKSHGASLVVSITSDRHIRKGAGRPYFNEDQRAEAIRALSFVDDVVITDAADAVPAIEAVRPNYYVKGSDYDGANDNVLDREREALEKVNGSFVTTKSDRWSSSRLITTENNNDEVNTYLENARAKMFLPRIEEAFEKAKSLKVAFVGETIIDEYVYGTPLSKPSKEFVLAMARHSNEEFCGGIFAASAHISDLCETRVVSQPQRAWVTKTRFVEQGFNRKLFEVYSPAQVVLSDKERDEFNRRVDIAMEWADVAIVIDFGHGLIDPQARENLVEKSKFLALNAQTNAGNQGFNPVTKYIAADYICVDLPEAKLAAQDADAKPKDLIEFLASKMGTEQVIVTHGREGAYWSGGNVPAMSVKPVDTMGAGDCFLAFTACLIASGLGIEEAAFVGNVAGSMKTEIVGHRDRVKSDVLMQTVRSMLK